MVIVTRNMSIETNMGQITQMLQLFMMFTSVRILTHVFLVPNQKRQIVKYYENVIFHEVQYFTKKRTNLSSTLL